MLLLWPKLLYEFLSCQECMKVSPTRRYLHQLTLIGYTLLSYLMLKDLWPGVSKEIIWIAAMLGAPLLPLSGNLIESLFSNTLSRHKKSSRLENP